MELERLLDYAPDSSGEQQWLDEELMRKIGLSLVEAEGKYPDWYERRM